MDGKTRFSPENGDQIARLAVCAVIGAAAVYAAERLCEGKEIPLWEKYGPWIVQNRVQAAAVLAAVLYGASLALWPQGLPKASPGGEEQGFTACP